MGKLAPKILAGLAGTAGVAVLVLGVMSYAGNQTAANFLDLVEGKIKSIITPKPPIGNLTPTRDITGTWYSSLKGKGIQTYSLFNAGGAVTKIYQEGDIELIVDSVDGNLANGTMRYINFCTWGQTTAPQVGTISIPKQCVTTEASPTQIRVSGSALDFGTFSSSGVSATMQGSYTTDLISGSMTAQTAWGTIKGEFHLMRQK